MKRGFIFLLLLAVAAFALWTSAFQVRESEYAIVTRFGDPRPPISEAGLHFKLPAPIDDVVRIDGRMHVLDPPADEYLSGDKKNVEVDSFLAWSVSDPLVFYRTVFDRSGAESRLADVLRSVLGEVLSAHPFSSLVSSEETEVDLEEINQLLTESAAARAEEAFGVKVSAVRVKRLSFPAQNKNAVFRRMETERASSASAIRSEGTEQYEKIKSEADRREAELIAEARREARELRGQAEAEAVRIYSEAIARDPELYELLRSLELLEEVVDEDTTMILPSDHPLLSPLEPPAPTPPKEGDE